MTTPSILPQLRAVFERVSLAEIRTLCFDLDIEYDELSGEPKSARVVSLLTYCANRERLSDVIDWLSEHRPDLRPNLGALLVPSPPRPSRSSPTVASDPPQSRPIERQPVVKSTGDRTSRADSPRKRGWLRDLLHPEVLPQLWTLTVGVLALLALLVLLRQPASPRLSSFPSGWVTGSGLTLRERDDSLITKARELIAAGQNELALLLAVAVSQTSDASEHRALLQEALYLAYAERGVAPSGADIVPPPVLRGHEGAVRSVQWSADGRLLLTAGDDRTARIWDVTSGTNLVTMIGHDDVIYAAAWVDDRTVRTLSRDSSVRYWNAQTGQEYTERRQLLIGTVRALQISPDGRWLLVGGQDDRARLCDLSAVGAQRWSEVCALGEPGTPGSLTGTDIRGYDVLHAVFSPDGRWMLTGAEDGFARLWSLGAADPTATPVVLFENEAPVRGMAFSADSRRLLVVSALGEWRRWQIADQVVMPLPDVRGRATPGLAMDPVAISPTDEWIAGWRGYAGGTSSDGSGGVEVFAVDVEGTTEREPLLSLNANDAQIHALSFHPAARLLAGASDDGSVYLWLLQTPASLRVAACHLLGRELRQSEWEALGLPGERPGVCVGYGS